MDLAGFMVVSGPVASRRCGYLHTLERSLVDKMVIGLRLYRTDGSAGIGSRNHPNFFEDNQFRRVGLHVGAVISDVDKASTSPTLHFR